MLQLNIFCKKNFYILGKLRKYFNHENFLIYRSVVLLFVLEYVWVICFLMNVFNFILIFLSLMLLVTSFFFPNQVWPNLRPGNPKLPRSFPLRLATTTFVGRPCLEPLGLTELETYYVLRSNSYTLDKYPSFAINIFTSFALLYTYFHSSTG